MNQWGTRTIYKIGDSDFTKGVLKRIETIEEVIELMSRERRYRNWILVRQYVSEAGMTYPEFELIIQ